MTKHEVLDPCKLIDLDHFHLVTWIARRIRLDYRRLLMIIDDKHKVKQHMELNANSISRGREKEPFMSETNHKILEFDIQSQVFRHRVMVQIVYEHMNISRQ